jgi:hypothetical protein
MNNFWIWTNFVYEQIRNTNNFQIWKFSYMNIFHVWTNFIYEYFSYMNKFEIWTIFKFEKKSKYEQFSNLNKNTNSEQKRKRRKNRKEKENRKKKEKWKMKFADQHGPGSNTSGCMGGMRRGAKSAANGRQIGIPLAPRTFALLGWAGHSCAFLAVGFLWPDLAQVCPGIFVPRSIDQFWLLLLI